MLAAIVIGREPASTHAHDIPSSSGRFARSKFIFRIYRAQCRPRLLQLGEGAQVAYRFQKGFNASFGSHFGVKYTACEE